MQLGYSRTLLRRALGVLASSHMLVCPPGFFSEFWRTLSFFSDVVLTDVFSCVLRCQRLTTIGIFIR